MLLHCLCVSTAMMVSAAADDSAAAKDLAALQGTWTVVTAERAGEKLPADKAEKMRVVIKDGTMTIQDGTDARRP